MSTSRVLFGDTVYLLGKFLREADEFDSPQMRQTIQQACDQIIESAAQVEWYAPCLLGPQLDDLHGWWLRTHHPALAAAHTAVLRILLEQFFIGMWGKRPQGGGWNITSSSGAQYHLNMSVDPQAHRIDVILTPMDAQHLPARWEIYSPCSRIVAARWANAITSKIATIISHDEAPATQHHQYVFRAEA
jgi:hypothetical protein